MKKVLFALTVLFSVSSFASVYNCKIDQAILGPEYNDNLVFELNTNDTALPVLSMYGYSIPDCGYENASKVSCRDDEGMPYIAEIESDTEVLITIGYYLNNQSAVCTKTE